MATLLIGVDTDTDAIKLHVPDAEGRICLSRFLDNAALFEATRELTRDAAKEAIRIAVAEAAGVSPDDAATEGMRWFCAYLLKNNIAQIEYVRAYHQGRYQDLGHTERFITVGDSFDDVIHGGEGNDELIGELNNDTLFGDGGNGRIPVVAVASVVLGIPLVLGLDEPKDVVMLALTFVVCAVTLATGRTHVMQGAVHVVMFAAFLFLALVP